MILLLLIWIELAFNDGLCVKVESLRQRCELQELELEKSTKKAQEAMALAAEESAKTKAAKEVIKSLTAQVIFKRFTMFCLWSMLLKLSLVIVQQKV